MRTPETPVTPDRRSARADAPVDLDLTVENEGIDGIPPDPLRARIAEVLHGCVDELTAAVARGFAQDRRRATPDPAEQPHELVGQILDGTIRGADAVAAAGDVLGHPNLSPCTLLVAAPSRDYHGASIAGAVTALLTDLDGPLRGPVRSTPVPHVAALVPHDADVSWTALLRGIGKAASAAKLVVAAEHVPRASLLPLTYEWTTALLAAPPASRPVGLVDLDDLVPAWVAGLVPERVDFAFVRRVLGPALASSSSVRRQLLDTVRAFLLVDGHVGEVAERTGVARRTVQRHLRAFEEVTGRSLRQPRQQALVRQALLVYDLRASAMPAPGSAEWSDGRASH